MSSASSMPCAPSSVYRAGLLCLRRRGLSGALVSFAAFFLAFSDARAVYGLFALVHAWIEIPILLLALAIRPGG